MKAKTSINWRIPCSHEFHEYGTDEECKKWWRKNKNKYFNPHYDKYFYHFEGGRDVKKGSY